MMKTRFISKFPPFVHSKQQQLFTATLLSFVPPSFPQHNLRITGIMIPYYIIIKWWAWVFKVLKFNPFLTSTSFVFIELFVQMKSLLTMHNWSSHGWIMKLGKERSKRFSFVFHFEPQLIMQKQSVQSYTMKRSNYNLNQLCKVNKLGTNRAAA